MSEQDNEKTTFLDQTDYLTESTDVISPTEENYSLSPEEDLFEIEEPDETNEEMEKIARKEVQSLHRFELDFEIFNEIGTVDVPQPILEHLEYPEITQDQLNYLLKNGHTNFALLDLSNLDFFQIDLPRGTRLDFSSSVLRGLDLTKFKYREIQLILNNADLDEVVLYLDNMTEDHDDRDQNEFSGLNVSRWLKQAGAHRSYFSNYGDNNSIQFNTQWRLLIDNQDYGPWAEMQRIAEAEAENERIDIQNDQEALDLAKEDKEDEANEAKKQLEQMEQEQEESNAHYLADFESSEPMSDQATPLNISHSTELVPEQKSSSNTLRSPGPLSFLHQREKPKKRKIVEIDSDTEETDPDNSTSPQNK